MTGPAVTVGILAYGWLIDDPGDELKPIIARTISDVATPFPVEFARSSGTRGGAPTRVPHPDGARVRASVLIVEASADKAADMLWRREPGKLIAASGIRGQDPTVPGRSRSSASRTSRAWPSCSTPRSAPILSR